MSGVSIASDIANGVAAHPLLAMCAPFGVWYASHFFPRAGPLRALLFAFRTKIVSAPSPTSVRTKEIARITNWLRGNWMVSSSAGPECVVVLGNSGVGKTHMVKSAFTGRCGVIEAHSYPSMSSEEIVADVLRTLTGLELTCMDPAPSARRVLFFYRMFCFPSPVVILHAQESYNGPPSSAITRAVRLLRDQYNLHVIVDAEHNSVPDCLLFTHQKLVVNVEPMDRATVLALPQLRQLVSDLEKGKLLDAAWVVLGGNPAAWESLLCKVRLGADAETFLCDQLALATRTLFLYRMANQSMKPVLERISASETLQICMWDALGLLTEGRGALLTANKVLSRQDVNGVNVLMPASAAMALVLRYKLRGCPTLEQLHELVRRELQRGAGRVTEEAE